MKIRMAVLAVAMMMVACGVQAQTAVKRIYSAGTPVASQRFAAAIWAGDTLYLSGQMASPVTAEDAAKGTPAVFGDTETQATSVLTKIEALLKTQGLTMGDVVEMQCFLAGDPAKGGKMDFAGLNAAYAKFFGTAEQPNRPVRAAMQVAALATDWGLVEIQVIAVRSKGATQESVDLMPAKK
ncbi:Rid family hydrolase [Granulicella sp. L46]|jgi:enamine deaminase RidA (YjgF/YER057c/UK114 family)|uniref:Rid family hydrolase n=1 Tax=Granulicella sp. L46 TaxID=1641865 RepID=UPI00131C74AA|nr:Rid family hydrolase [Granulicella sp. L46]